MPAHDAVQLLLPDTAEASEKCCDVDSCNMTEQICKVLQVVKGLAAPQ